MTELELIRQARLTPRRRCSCALVDAQVDQHRPTSEAELIAARGLELDEFDRRRYFDGATMAGASVRDAEAGPSS